MSCASIYNIYVDLPENPDEVLLVHGYTGAYDKVSARLGRYVYLREERTPHKPLHGSWNPRPTDEDGDYRPSPDVWSTWGAAAILRKRAYRRKW